MGSLRDKYKATSTKVITSQADQEDKSLSVGGSKADYLSIDDGKNQFRFFPKHADDKNYMRMKKQWWLPKEDEESGKTKNWPTPHAEVHGNGSQRDIVEAYMTVAKDILDGGEADKKKIKKIFSNSFNGGLLPSTSWVARANKLTKDDEAEDGYKKEFGELEFKKSVRDDLNKIATADDDDEPVLVEPFTDCDDGHIVNISYNPDANKATDYYDTGLGRKPKKLALTDDELEMLNGLDSLKSLYTDTYTRDDFERAVEGLEIWDEENEIGVFESDEFQAVLEEIGEEMKNAKSKPKKEDTEEEKPKAKAKKKAAPVVVEEEEEEDEDEKPKGDDLDGLDRNELKSFISENGLGKDDLGDDRVKVTKSMDEDDIREAIREKRAELAEEVKPAAEEEEEDEDEDDVPSLDSIKDRLAKNKGK